MQQSAQPHAQFLDACLPNYNYFSKILIHDFTNYKLLQFNLNLFLASTNYFQSDLIIQLKKVRKAVQELCEKPAGSVLGLLRICLTVVRFSIHIPAVAVSKEPQT